MPEVKYAIFPDWIISRNDGEPHFVGADQLMRLHGVRPEECVVVRSLEAARSYKTGGLTLLYPQHDYLSLSSGSNP